MALPADCASFTRRLADVNWSHGTLVTPPTPDEPLDALDRGDGSVAAVLDEAEDFLNSIGAQVVAEVAAEKAKRGPLGPDGQPQSRLKRLFRRKGDEDYRRMRIGRRRAGRPRRSASRMSEDRRNPSSNRWSRLTRSPSNQPVSASRCRSLPGVDTGIGRGALPWATRMPLASSRFEIATSSGIR